jgi:ribosomal protein S11
MAETRSAIEGTVGFGKQASKGTPASAFDVFRHTSFTWTPDVVQDEEPEAELGSGLDVEQPLRYGFRGATFNGEIRFRPGHAGHIFRDFGMLDESGGLVVWTGVNDTIYVTDDGGGPTAVNILTGTDMVSGTRYTPTEFAAWLKEALDEQMSDVFTVTYSSVTKLWTIASDGAVTLSLHHTTLGGQMMANMLGFDIAADDTGAYTYDSDETREYAGRWILTGDNDALVVTDSLGGPTTVNILTTRSDVRYHALTGWQLAAALKSALEAQMTGIGIYTVLYDDTAASNKFYITSDQALLTIPWTDASCTIEEELGFTADDSGGTEYTADTALIPAKKHSFIVVDTSDEFPWYTIYDQMDSAATPSLNTVLRDCRINNFTIDAKENDVIRLSYSGRALHFSNALGSETENAEETSIAAPVSSAGSLKFLTTEDYPLIDLNIVAQWAEQLESQLTTITPRSLVPGRRSVKGNSRVSLSAEDTGGLFKKVYYGGSSGTAPSVSLVDSPLDVAFEAGQELVTTGTTEYYGVRFILGGGKLLSYPLTKAGDGLVQGQLMFAGHRQTYDWAVVLTNNEDDGAYA